MFQKALVGVWATCAILTLTVNPTAAATSTPYTGNAVAVPGTIEAENFDNGGEGVAYHDSTIGNSLGAFRQTDVDIEAATEGGYDIGKIKVGEWLKYTVNVSWAGNYVLDARVASLGQGGTFHIEFGDKDVTGALTVPNTGGWQNWTTISTTVALPEGPQIMRVVFDTPAPASTAVGNLNWVRFSPASSAPYLGTAAAVPGILNAENFDNGGEGIAYHDSTVGNAGGQYRSTDVDVERSSLGGYDVGWMVTGEWLAYTVNVATAGRYTLQLQVASKYGGGQLHATFGSTNTSTVAVPSTGAWQTWTTVTTTANLTAGVQVMKLVVDTGGFNVAGMTLTLPPPPPPPVPTSPSIADGAVGVTMTPYLSWQAPDATSCDIRLGTTNPPSTAVSNTPTYFYAPGLLTASTTYYWQVVAKNAYGATAGPVWSFTTAAPGAPTSYNAIADRTARPKPALPALGAAGFRFADPTFSSAMVRVTDANTRPTSINLSYRSPSAGHQVGWNATSTYFYVISTDGTVIPYSFNADTMTASRIPGSGDGGLTLLFINEPEFSANNPNVVYGVAGGLHKIAQYDFSTSAYSTVIDLDTVVSGLSGYIGGQAVGGMNSGDNIMTFFGGPSQDQHHYALWFPVNNPSARKLLDTTASTVNGVPTTVALNFRLHSASIDRSGRYVLLYPTGTDQASPRYASQEYIWDTATDVITALTSGGKDGGPDLHPYGHDAPGFGYNVNADCCTTSTWDAAQWQVRSLATPLSTSDLISPVLTPKEVYSADHTSWNNAQATTLVPVISARYRMPAETAAWRAWDDEIIAVETAAAPAAGATVWRFAHHRSNIVNDINPLGLWFWYTPRPNVSRDGRWAIFTSNWEKTLGRDPKDGTFREDVFLVQLR